MRKFIPVFLMGVFSVGAYAGDYGADKQASFEALDKNSDQQISMTEARADEQLAANFSAADTNGDGYVSADEFAAYKGA
jgi:Ca2+-binding EF-hand superfamily protein